MFTALNVHYDSVIPRYLVILLEKIKRRNNRLCIYSVILVIGLFISKIKLFLSSYFCPFVKNSF